MIGQDKLHNILTDTLKKAEAEATAVCIASSSGLTRYANNYVHQNMHTENTEITFRAKVGDRLGQVSVNSLNPAELAAALQRAEQIAKAGPPIPDLPPLPLPQTYATMKTYVEATADFTPEQRAVAAKSVCDAARAAGGVASGFMASGCGELAVANTNGLWAYAPLTSAKLMAIVGDGPASGYAGGISRNVAGIDHEAAGRRAVQKLQADRKRLDIAPGEYEVIIEPEALNEAFNWLSYIAFSSRSAEEESSFLTGKTGQRIAQPAVHIYDDAFDEASLALPFDFEGLPKQRVDLIKEGIAGNCVLHTPSALRAGQKSTGHMPPPRQDDYGALPMHIGMTGGNASLDEMIAEMERGILITRFHYLNGFIDPRNGVLTGMTRDGTFLIEGGKIVGGLPNLRFMQSFVEAFDNVKRISRERQTCANGWEPFGACRLPALHLGRFRFTGVQKEK